MANDCIRLENAKIAPDLVDQQLTNLLISKFREMLVECSSSQQDPYAPHEGILGRHELLLQFDKPPNGVLISTFLVHAPSIYKADSGNPLEMRA